LSAWGAEPITTSNTGLSTGATTGSMAPAALGTLRLGADLSTTSVNGAPAGGIVMEGLKSAVGTTAGATAGGIDTGLFKGVNKGFVSGFIKGAVSGVAEPI